MRNVKSASRLIIEGMRAKLYAISLSRLESQRSHTHYTRGGCGYPTAGIHWRHLQSRTNPMCLLDTSCRACQSTTLSARASWPEQRCAISQCRIVTRIVDAVFTTPCASRRPPRG